MAADAKSNSGVAAADTPRAARSPEQSLVVIGEVQLLLSEKRTSLSTMRTGIAVLALPLSAFSVLIATSRYYDVARVAYLLVLMFLLNAALIALGSYLIVRAIRKIQEYDRHIEAIKQRNAIFSDMLE